jgi:hypothetical protein
MGNTPNNNFPFPESTDLVKDGAQAIEDLADAIDTTLGVYSPAGASGLTLISTTSFSAVSSVSLPNGTFSATYDNYLIKFNSLVGSTEGYATFRMRASGSDDSTSNYRNQQINSFSTTLNSARATGLSLWDESIHIGTTWSNDADLTLCDPFASKATSGMVRTIVKANGNIEWYQKALGLNTSTSYDSLTLIKSAGNMTGSISVYGFSK